MDRGAWQATVHGVTKSGTREQLTLSISEIYIDAINESADGENFMQRIALEAAHPLPTKGEDSLNGDDKQNSGMVTSHPILPELKSLLRQVTKTQTKEGKSVCPLNLTLGLRRGLLYQIHELLLQIEMGVNPWIIAAPSSWQDFPLN